MRSPGRSPRLSPCDRGSWSRRGASDRPSTTGPSRALDRPLRLHPTALEWVAASYRDLAARGLAGSADLTPEREKMARLPEGARPVRNRVGAAPAVAIETGGAVLLCLPGVPDEMR